MSLELPSDFWITLFLKSGLPCMKWVEYIKDIRLFRTLRLISYATRPLHIEELGEAIAFDLHDTTWDAGKIPPGNFVAGCCSNLAVVDTNDSCVYFAHFSVKRYLGEHVAGRAPRYPSSHLQAELECGEFCVTYLSFSNFGLELRKHIEFVSNPLNPMALAALSMISHLSLSIHGIAPLGMAPPQHKLQKLETRQKEYSSSIQITFG